MQASMCHRRLREDMESVEDDKRSRPLQTSRTAENIERTSAADLNMHRVCQQIVLLMLNEDQSADDVKSASRAELKSMAKKGFSRNVSMTFTSHGYVKSLVYADKPQTLDHLEDNIRRVIADIRPQMLEKVIENWTSRLDYIRASRGSPMPEIIFKIMVKGFFLRVPVTSLQILRIFFVLILVSPEGIRWLSRNGFLNYMYDEAFWTWCKFSTQEDRQQQRHTRTERKL
ncbi:hypothetical protein TNCV_4443501 [Trichonephila clavipes]|nr:hypothetical protein TNCV_4443501 [Trichonephila clavipes]